jgi:hypothetical protein
MEFVSNFNAEIVGYIRKRFREGADDPTLMKELDEKWPTMFPMMPLPRPTLSFRSRRPPR